MDGNSMREMGYKRQHIDTDLSYYGAPTGSSVMYNTSPYMGEIPPFPVVRLRGLPFDCMESDVTEFFHDLCIVDILFVHKNGRFSGEAFCVLGYPLQVDLAVRRDRQSIGRRYVEVFRSNRQEYYRAVANEFSDTRGGSSRQSIQRVRSNDDHKDTAEHTGILRLRGLPFSAGKDDVLDFFKDFDLSEDRVHFVVNSDGRPAGEAFVEFHSVEDSRDAMVKDRMTLGSRYIELFPSSAKELDESVSRG